MGGRGREYVSLADVLEGTWPGERSACRVVVNASPCGLVIETENTGGAVFGTVAVSRYVLCRLLPSM